MSLAGRIRDAHVLGDCAREVEQIQHDRRGNRPVVVAKVEHDGVRQIKQACRRTQSAADDVFNDSVKISRPPRPDAFEMHVIRVAPMIELAIGHRQPERLSGRGHAQRGKAQLLSIAMLRRKRESALLKRRFRDHLRATHFVQVWIGNRHPRRRRRFDSQAALVQAAGTRARNPLLSLASQPVENPAPRKRRTQQTQTDARSGEILDAGQRTDFVPPVLQVGLHAVQFRGVFFDQVGERQLSGSVDRGAVSMHDRFLPTDDSRTLCAECGLELGCVIPG